MRSIRLCYPLRELTVTNNKEKIYEKYKEKSKNPEFIKKNRERNLKNRDKKKQEKLGKYRNIKFKVCKECNQNKSRAEYRQNIKGIYHLNDYCEPCFEKILKERKIRDNKRSRNYYQKNKERLLKNDYQRKKERLKIDIEYRIKETLSHRIRMTISKQRGIKSERTIKLLGAPIEVVRKHLENLFEPGMTWDNYGLHGWHIDHIKPCSLFNLKDEKEQLECFNYKNLQPLWAYDNLIKGNKYKEDK